MLNALAPARSLFDPAPGIQRLGLGLPGSLILFAPLAFVSQRQVRTREPPAPLVFFPISAHFTATPEIPLPSHALQLDSIERPLQVKPGAFTPNLPNRLQTLYAQSFRITLASYVLPRLLARS